jgi:hypothetical protein
MRRLLSVWVVTAVGCSAPSPLVMAPMAPPSAPVSVSAKAHAPEKTDYPPQYAVLDEETLVRLTQEKEAKTPGWSLELDPFGMLLVATWTHSLPGPPGVASITIPSEERKEADRFLSVQADLVALDAPFAQKKVDNARRVLFQQITSGGIAASVSVDRLTGVLTIRGHLWPNLPPAGPWLSDAKLTATLQTLDTAPDLLPEHCYTSTAPSTSGPLEMREALCLMTAVDGIDRSHPKRPCLDARTGEDITARQVSSSVSAVNGKVVARGIHFAGPSGP